MAEEKKVATPKAESKSGTSEGKTSSKDAGSTSNESKSKSSESSGGGNGKGSSPRNIFSEDFRKNFDAIDWSK